MGRNILKPRHVGGNMADDWQEPQRQERERQEQQRNQEQQRLRTPAEVENQAKSDHVQFPTGWADQSGWSTPSKNAYDTQRSFEQREQQRKAEEGQRQLRKPFWKFW